MEQALVKQEPRALPDDVMQSARDYVNASKKDNTRTTYRKVWASFERFCVEHGYQARPAAVQAIVHYLTCMADDGYKVSTIELHKSAISFAHGGKGAEHNPALAPEVRVLMQGI